MEIINGFSAFIVLFSFIALCIGLIKPNWLKLTSRKSVIFITLSIFFLFMIIFSFTMSEEQKKSSSTHKNIEIEPPKSNSNNIEKLNKPVEVETKNLGLTPEQFRKVFNSKLTSLDVKGLRPLAEFSIRDGNVKDTFTVNITNAVSIVGKVSKSGKIESLIMMYDHSDVEKESLNYILLTGLMIQAVSNDDEIPKQVAPLLTYAVKNMESEKENNFQIINDIKYSATSDKATGTWFIIEPK